jgi:hypothetical protein
VPEHLAGNRVTCPRCGEAVSVPLPEAPPEEALAAAVKAAAPRPDAGAACDLEHAPPTMRLGVMALGLGLLAVLVLCVPFVGYASFVLSGLGMLCGLWGLVRSLQREAGGSRPAGVGRRGLTYPLAGTLASLGALFLALLPYLLGGH